MFMPRYDFHLSAANTLAHDNHFGWDTHFGGDFDLVDYVHGRMIFLADYQAVLGSQIRPFDPYEGNYTLGAGGSFRFRGTEFVTVLHHESRHLGDRPKLVPVAWNEVDMRVVRHFAADASTVDVKAEAGKVIRGAGVDYNWNTGLDVTVRRPIRPYLGVFGRTAGQAVFVNDDLARTTLTGGRVEGGVRFQGRGGAVELMSGVERVIDADLFDGLTRHWFYAGFRFVTK
jgi:hypothetical protein